MDHTLVRDAVDELHHAFAEFKATNEERLAQLETQKIIDPVLEHKMERLNGTLDQATERLNRLEAASKRPTLAGECQGSRLIEQEGHKSAFLTYVRKGQESGLLDVEKKTLSSLNNQDGGFLIPLQISDQIISTLTETSPMRQVARVMTITSDAVELLIDKDEADAGWASEAQNREETDAPEWSRIRIPVHEMYAKPRATQKLLDDAHINLEEWLASKISQKMAHLENQAFFYGDGQGKPRGFLNYPTASGADWNWGKLEHISSGTDGDFGKEGTDVLLSALHALKPQYMAGAVWMMPRSVQSHIRKLKDKQGQYIWQPGLDKNAVATLLGHPIVLADDMPGINPGQASASIAFGNFKEGYQIVDRQGTRTLRDPFSAKPYVEFYTTRRVGGDVVNFEAIKLVRFSAN